MPQDPVRVAQKWARNLGAAGESIKAGVEGVTESPTAKAAAAQDRYLSGVQRAVTDGSYQRGLRAVTLQDWQQSMLKKGLQRITQGAQEGMTKMQTFMSRWLPHMDALKARISSMPKGTLSDSLERVRVAMEHAASFKGRVS
jgi:hypothetical protein